MSQFHKIIQLLPINSNGKHISLIFQYGSAFKIHWDVQELSTIWTYGKQKRTKVCLLTFTVWI